MRNPALEALTQWLSSVPNRFIACSGGVDSMLLATVAHRHDPLRTRVVHDVTPAVPAAATARVIEHADAQGWNLTMVSSSEFADERYLENPRNRCYFCKSHLYDAIGHLTRTINTDATEVTLLSGANTDDTKEFRPGLQAADEHGVRHPYVELGIAKSDIRSMARDLGLNFSEIPASPCLASRLYTGTRVSVQTLRSVEVGEEVLRQRTGIDVVRCRIDDTTVHVEVPLDQAHRITQPLLDAVMMVMHAIEPRLSDIDLDQRGYSPGRAFELTVLT